MKVSLKKLLLYVAAVVALTGLGACAVLQHPAFGKLPAGPRLAAVQASPHYRDGAFQNAVPTPISTDGTPFLLALVRGRFEARPSPPAAPIPSVKTDLRALPVDVDTVVWLGHSSFYVHLGGRRILIDPVLSSYAAPFPGIVKAFEGTTIYGIDDLPPIDYLLITHDHYDHLDRNTVLGLIPKTRWAVTGLGVGAHLEHWGFPPEKIREGDWFDTIRLEPALTIHVLPARHYSGRALKRNQSLWVGYALESRGRRLLFGGDSGFGPHIAEIAKRFDGFDLAVLDAGQYNPRWAYIHMNPEEASRAAEVLRAKALLPAHVGRFTLARHAWDEPFDRAVAAASGKAYRLLTPRIGEPLHPGTEQQFTPWWRSTPATTPPPQ